MESTVGFGLIGCGTMGSRHAECIVDAKGASLIAVCDIRRQNAERIADAFKAEVVPDAGSLVNHPDVRAVVVALPSTLHAQYGILVAEAEKHVMMEKPIELSLERAKELIKTCREHNVLLTVVSQHRFHPDVLKLKHAITDGKLGRLILCSAQSEWKRDQAYYEKAPGRGLSDPSEGGVLINQAVHYIDLLLWLCGPVSKVSAYRGTLTHKIAVEDVAAVILQFTDGALGTITASTSVSPQQKEKLEIHGERGTVIIESGKRTVWDIEGEGTQQPDDPPREVFKPELAPVRRQVEDFAAAVRLGRPPLVTGEEGLAVLATILAAYRSADNRRSENL
jgi:UDP-N-acetyl-2-amino-2-deoxyglucuronate dehydrogenase